MNYYLYLDIDGVLNDHTWNDIAQSCSFKKECVEVFNNLIEIFRPKIILSSAWRYMILNGAMTLKGFKYLLGTHGIYVMANVIDTTSFDEFWPTREKQITAHIIANPQIQNYAIVDDMELKFSNPEIQKRYIRTDGKIGLTENDAETIKKIWLSK